MHSRPRVRRRSAGGARLAPGSSQSSVESVRVCDDTLARPAGRPRSDQSCLAVAYMCVSLDVHCTKIRSATVWQTREGNVKTTDPARRPAPGRADAPSLRAACRGAAGGRGGREIRRREARPALADGRRIRPPGNERRPGPPVRSSAPPVPIAPIPSMDPSAVFIFCIPYPHTLISN